MLHIIQHLRYYSSDEEGGYTLVKVFHNGSRMLTKAGRPIFSLEDEYRKLKVSGETRIAAGLFPVYLENSPKFGDDTPTITVTGFTGVRIHPYNTEDQTDGCIGYGNSVGIVRGKTAILESKKTTAEVVKLIRDWIRAGDEVYLLMTDYDIGRNY